MAPAKLTARGQSVVEMMIVLSVMAALWLSGQRLYEMSTKVFKPVSLGISYE